MASIDDSALPSLPFRVYGLEGQVKTQDAAINRLRENTAGHSQAISAQAVTLAKHDEQISGANADIVEVKTDVAALAVSVATLGEKVASSTTRVAWALVGFAFTVAGSAIALVIASAP